jgi:hypothetical protein
MMSNDSCNLGIRINIGENTLTNLGVALHLAPFLKGERTGFLEKPSWKADLPYVVH